MFNQQLQVLVCVADCGSFTRAAQKLYLSPTAVMKQINSLEEHLDLQLLVRTRHGVHLTAAGQSIYEDAQRLFVFSREAISRARRIAETVKTTFRIGSSMLNPCKVFMNLWNRVSRDFPQYTLRIVPYEDNRKGIVAEISAMGDKFDFLVAACNSQTWLNHCNFLAMGAYRMCCAVSKSHRLAGRNVLQVEDLFGETLILGAEGDSTAVDSVRSTLQKYPEIRLEDTSCFYDIDVFNKCEQEQKILLTLECWSDIHPSLVTLPVQWSFTVPYGVLYPLQPDEDIQAVIAALDRVQRSLQS